MPNMPNRSEKAGLGVWGAPVAVFVVLGGALAWLAAQPPPPEDPPLVLRFEVEWTSPDLEIEAMETEVFIEPSPPEPETTE